MPQVLGEGYGGEGHLHHPLRDDDGVKGEVHLKRLGGGEKNRLRSHHSVHTCTCGEDDKTTDHKRNTVNAEIFVGGLIFMGKHPHEN